MQVHDPSVFASAHELLAIEAGLADALAAMHWGSSSQCKDTLERFDVLLHLFTNHIHVLEESMLSDDDIGILEDIYKAEPGDIVFFDID